MGAKFCLQHLEAIKKIPNLRNKPKQVMKRTESLTVAIAILFLQDSSVKASLKYKHPHFLTRACSQFSNKRFL